MSAAKAVEAKSFEAASKRLDELLNLMENGQLPLEKMISAFEEGRKLVAFCNAKLAEVEQRVEKIKAAEADGTLAREPFSEMH